MSYKAKAPALLVLLFALAGCQTIFSSKKPDAAGISVVTDEGEASKTGGGRRVVMGEEAREESLEKCLYLSGDSALLGLGFALYVASPLAPVIGFGYIGAAYYRCYWVRQNDRPTTVELDAVVEEARREAVGEIKEDFDAIRRDLSARKNSADVNVDELKRELRRAGEEERRRIEKLGGRVMREVYQQIDELKHGTYEITPGE